MSIRPKNAKCLDCGKFGPVTAERCPYCYRAYRAKVAAQDEGLKEYRKLRKEYLAAYPMCQHPECVRAATEVHHAKGRTGKLLTDVRHFRGLCHEHHVWVELHPDEAKKLGLSASRLSENQ